MTTLVRFVIISILSIIGIKASKAQTKEAIVVFEKLKEVYAGEANYTLKMTYTMYRGYTGNQITEQYSGTLYKKGEIFQMKAMDMEALQFSEGQLKINHKTKTVYYSQLTQKMNNPADISQILQFYKPVSLKTQEGVNIIELDLKNQQIPLPFQKVMLHVHGEKNTLLKQELFFSKKIPFVTDSGTQEYDTARVEIEFSEIHNKDNHKVFSHYIVQKGASLVLADTYKEYKLINQTNQ